MNIIRCGFALAVLSMLAACGERKEPEPMPVEETVFADQVKALDKAEDRAREMEGRMQDLNRELEKSEGAPASEEDAADSRN